jgi:pectin methylesterase-like acyl-CoA thioesterase
MKFLALGLSLVSLALAASRKSAPKGALTVGQGQKFTTISAAVAALSNTTTSEQLIFVHPGTYAEQVYIPKLSGPLTVQGYTTDDSKYAKNQVTIVASESQKTQPNLTGTLRVWTSNFKLYNVNVRNAFGEGSQAIALSAQAGVSLSCLSMQTYLHRTILLTPTFSLTATRLLRRRPLRLPRHPPFQHRHPALRQILHRGRHRFHLRAARASLV